jgi:hypothetical protein
VTRGPEAKPIRKLRCAVYTRKSTEEGLDKEFNSLQAQRGACEAYIASQRSEGWALVLTSKEPIQKRDAQAGAAGLAAAEYGFFPIGTGM